MRPWLLQLWQKDPLHDETRRELLVEPSWHASPKTGRTSRGKIVLRAAPAVFHEFNLARKLCTLTGLASCCPVAIRKEACSVPNAVVVPSITRRWGLAPVRRPSCAAGGIRRNKFSLQVDARTNQKGNEAILYFRIIASCSLRRFLKRFQSVHVEALELPNARILPRAIPCAVLDVLMGLVVSSPVIPNCCRQSPLARAEVCNPPLHRKCSRSYCARGRQY